uniref:GMC oxidoreductase n=1 Tax=Brucella pseudintermedia TaxID=370111 RepID=UPI0022A66C53|nr:GMC family oxidoreductase [Brucella pseudintermedia]
MAGLFLQNSGWHIAAVWLSTPDADAEPDVDFRMLSDERDLTRLQDAVRKGASILSDPNMRNFAGTVFPSSYTPRVAKVATPGTWNAFQRGTLSAMLDAAGPFRTALIHAAITSGVSIGSLLEDDAALTSFVRMHVGGTWHPSGTCRMGLADDPFSVTDAGGKVHGVDGLRVCDASLMPAIPCANTNMPTLMIAERIADMIKSKIH